MDGCDLPGCDLPDLPGCDMPDFHFHSHGCDGCVAIPVPTTNMDNCIHPTTMLMLIGASFVVYLLSLGLDEADTTSQTLRQIIVCIGCVGVGGFLVACFMGHKKNHDRRNQR